MLAKKIVMKSFFAMLLMAILSTVNAEGYSPFSKKLAAQLVAIKSVSSIDVSAETWPGFSRTFSISLSNIDTPKNSPDVSLCQQQLAQKALDFVQDYLGNASKIEIHNMTMKTSADTNANAELYTEKGSLNKALLSHGFARSDGVEQQKPWC